MKTFGFIVSEIVIFIIIAGIVLIITNDWFFPYVCGVVACAGLITPCQKMWGIYK